MASIQMRYSVSRLSEPRTAYKLRAEVLAADGLDPEIFVFRRRPPALDPQINASGDEFQHVADPVDFERYPADAPDLLNHMPYYRLRTVELVFKCVSDLDETRNMLKSDIALLAKHITMLADIPDQEDVLHEG